MNGGLHPFGFRLNLMAPNNLFDHKVENKQTVYIDEWNARHHDA